MVSLENVFAGDWRAGAAAAEPSDGARVHGSEAGAGHQAVPPHREGQAGILSTVCYVVDGQVLWDMAASCFTYSFWENMEDVQLWLVFFIKKTPLFLRICSHKCGSEVGEATFPEPLVQKSQEKESKTFCKLTGWKHKGGMEDALMHKGFQTWAWTQHPLML